MFKFHMTRAEIATILAYSIGEEGERFFHVLENLNGKLVLTLDFKEQDITADISGNMTLEVIKLGLKCIQLQKEKELKQKEDILSGKMAVKV